MTNYKPYVYKKGIDPAMDADFVAAQEFGKVRPGSSYLFWKSGLRWYSIPMDGIRRIFRRVEPVYGKLCCGGHSFIIEWLVLHLPEGGELVLHIGDDVKKKAEELLEHLKQIHPEISYGKVS